jgi:hypothetical protein
MYVTESTKDGGDGGWSGTGTRMRRIGSAGRDVEGRRRDGADGEVARLVGSVPLSRRVGAHGGGRGGESDGASEAEWRKGLQHPE